MFSGTFQAAYGAFMVLSGLELGFFVEKYVGQGVATGTFVNRNHLAGYLVMCLSAGIGLLLSQLATNSAHNWKDRLRRWLRLLLSSKIRLRIYLAIMVIALVLTRARMGNVAFFTALGVAGALALYTGRGFSWRVLVTATAPVAAATPGFAATPIAEPPVTAPVVPGHSATPGGLPWPHLINTAGNQTHNTVPSNTASKAPPHSRLEAKGSGAHTRIAISAANRAGSSLEKSVEEKVTTRWGWASI